MSPFYFFYPGGSDHTRQRYPRVMWWVGGILGIVLVLPLLPPLLPSLFTGNLYYHLHYTHALLELFCAFVAILIAGTASGIYFVLYPRTEAFVFVLAFLAMGLFDFAHAMSKAGSEQFVLLHSLSVAWGGVLIFLACAAMWFRVDLGRPIHRRLFLVVSALLALNIVWAVFADSSLPKMVHLHQDRQEFTIASVLLNSVGGIFFSAAALVCYRAFRRDGDLSLMAFAGILVLFAESAFLFPLSSLWDVYWWLWHAIKVFLYVAMLVLLVFGYIVAILEMQASRDILAKANIHLERQRKALAFQNKVLAGRNAIAECTAHTLDIGRVMNALETSISKLAGPVKVNLTLNANLLLNPDLIRYDLNDEDKHTSLSQFPDCCDHRIHAQCACSANIAAETKAHKNVLCFPLLAHDQLIGRLLISHESSLPIEKAPMIQIRRMVETAGPALDSAIRYSETAWASRFQTSMRHVMSMMMSSLSVNDILTVVCAESAKLMKADGASIWMLQHERQCLVQTASYCGLHGVSADASDVWGSELPMHEIPAIESVLTNGRSIALNRSRENEASGIFKTNKRDWQWLGIFPVSGRDDLLGIMVLLRCSKVAFSDNTLNMGYLLAQHAGIALQNALLIDELSQRNKTIRQNHLENLRSEKLAVLGRMSTNVAHELRNPLGAMSNCIQLIKKRQLGTKARHKAFAILENELERLGRLANDFIAFGTPQRMRFVLTDPVELMQGMVERMRAHIVKCGLSIRIVPELSPSLAKSYMDPDRIQQVLWNLFLNSVDAIGSAGTISCGVREEDGKLRLNVTDTGCGIRKDRLQQVFEPFYTQRARGSGLGLAIVKQIVEAHGGDILVESEPGKRTAMNVSLPLREGYAHAISA